MITLRVFKLLLTYSFYRESMLDPKDENSHKQRSLKGTIRKIFKKKIAGYKSFKLIKGSEEIDYDVAHAYGRIVIQRVHEVSYEKGLKN
ncbi:MAG: hypothetical protein ABI315_08575 [Bacteroidia bacterium]